MTRKLTDDERKLIAKLIDDAAKSGKLSKVSIAGKAGYDERTVRSVLAGNTASFETYQDVCGAVGLSIETILSQASTKNTAPEPVGGYSREMYAHYVGDYVTIRPKYDNASVIKSYQTRIFWNDAQGCYWFEERNRADSAFAHQGQLHIPRGSVCVYLVTMAGGWVRNAIVSQLIPGASEMRGLICSQFNIAGPAFAPVAAPIAYLKVSTIEPSYGELTKSDPNYDRYLAILQETVQNSYARFVLPPMPGPSLNVVPLTAQSA
jgi:hypothetical protein